MIEKINNEMDDEYQNVIKNIHDINQSLTKLREIALKPDYLTDVEYIDTLINSEEKEAKTGYRKRINYLQQIRKDVDTFYFAKITSVSMDSDQYFREFRIWKSTQKEEHTSPKAKATS